MNLQQELLNTALLGTAKRSPPDAATLPESVRQAWAALPDGGSEDRFFQLSVLASAYEDGSSAPFTAVGAWLPVLPVMADGTAKFLPAAAVALLRKWLQDNQPEMVAYALAQTAQHGFSLPRQLLSALFAYRADKNDIALENHFHNSVFGAQGRWLWQCMGHEVPPDTHAEPDDEDWHLGSLQQRLQWLRAARRHQPDHAREQVEAVWKTTPADQRANYLNIFSCGLSPADEAFLHSALSDRSKQVKDTAARLLFRLPESRWVGSHLQWLGERLHYHADTQQWTLHDSPYRAEMKAAGIDEISREKNCSDSEYQVMQIIERLTLGAWARFLNSNENEAAAVLAASPPLPRWRSRAALCGWVAEKAERPLCLAAAQYIVRSGGQTEAASWRVLLHALHPHDLNELLAQHRFHLPRLCRPSVETVWGKELSLAVLAGIGETVRHITVKSDWETQKWLAQIGTETALHLHADDAEVAAAADKLLQQLADTETELPHFVRTGCERLVGLFRERCRFEQALKQ